MKETCVFLSYIKADRTWAETLSALLASSGFAVSNPPSAPFDPTGKDPMMEELRHAIERSTHTLVLVGPTTRLSKWVDREIEFSTELRDDGPGAGLIGVILPSHDDFSRPYYDPKNVPVRLHDLTQAEYAIIRKWTDNPDEINRWLHDAARRRQSHRAEPSLGAAAEIYRFAWDKNVDESRPNPEAL